MPPVLLRHSYVGFLNLTRWLFLTAYFLSTGITSLVLIAHLPDHRALRSLFTNPMRTIPPLLASRLMLKLRRFAMEPDISLNALSKPIRALPHHVDRPYQLRPMGGRRYVPAMNDAKAGFDGQ